LKLRAGFLRASQTLTSIAFWCAFTLLWLFTLAPFFILFPRSWWPGGADIVQLAILIVIIAIIVTVGARAPRLRPLMMRLATLGATSTVVVGMLTRLGWDFGIPIPRLVHAALALDGESAMDGAEWEHHCIMFTIVVCVLALAYRALLGRSILSAGRLNH
jgi:hypothetical protein